mmetsp:Transcript_36759/g.80031  ORF Transcript_36759/g.80031 Transcript_36759/m.80031 type:complete len:210 (-) Transcript_36759:339-968(-)
MRIGKPMKFFKPLMFVDLKAAESKVSMSFVNEREANFIAVFVKALLRRHKDHIAPCDIGVITFYARQVKTIRDAIKLQMKWDICLVTVNTVDGFQGSENNIIILSTVRRSENDYKKSPNESIGFLKDERRSNVAISRGKCMTFVLGQAKLLRQHETWKELIKYCLKFQAFVKVSNTNDFINEHVFNRKVYSKQAVSNTGLGEKDQENTT